MTERMNMLRIAAPEKVPEDVPFSVERDITASDWEGITTEAERARNDKNWEDFVYVASRIHVLDPERTPLISEAEWDEIMEKRDVLQKDGLVWQKDVDLLQGIRTLRPESTELEKDRAGWEKYLKKLKQNARGNSDWDSVALCEGFMQVAYPGRSPIADPDWKHMLDGLSKARDMEREGWSYQTAANMRLIRDDPALVATKKEWDKVRELLKLHRDQRGYHLFCYVAARAKILAAEEVRVTEHGLEFKMPTRQKDEATPVMPDTLAV